MKIARALISVSDKSGIAKFARALERQGVDIISTGGTADLLRKEKIPVRDISSFTAFPEVLEGRVKTLHPRVHGGLLYKRGNAKHEAEAREIQEKFRLLQNLTAHKAREREYPLTPIPRARKKRLSRNSPCPCNSGKRYKRCCGKNILG